MTQDKKITAKKTLGQHFLHSPSALAKIVQAAHIREGEMVLEIGPGTGILTCALLEAGAKVIAVEKDIRAYVLLKSDDLCKKYAEEGKLELINADILECDLPSLSDAHVSFSIVANIPYYITGAILERFLEHGPRPSRMILLVQKEVADRIAARHGKESILSISVKAFGTPKVVAAVPRGAFVPPPSVDSAILAIDDISDSRFEENAGPFIKKFFELVRAGFAHKRKFLIRNLESVAETEALRNIWKKIGLDENIRAERLDVNDWIKLAGEINAG